MDEPSETQQPQTQPEQESSASSWWGSFYDTAKKKLAETNEFMQRDISEFTQAVQHDAAKLITATTSTMKEKLNIDVDSGLENASSAGKTIKDSLSSFIGTIQHSVGPILPGEDENDDSSVVMGTTSGVKVLSPAEARLMSLQSDPATFCNEPDHEAEFDDWSESFKMEDVKGQISELMLDCTQIRALYTKLVPNAVSHFEFWTRYFYKLHLHEKNELRRIKLVERAEQKEDISWEDEEDDWVHPQESEVKEAQEEEEDAVTKERPEEDPVTKEGKEEDAVTGEDKEEIIDNSTTATLETTAEDKSTNETNLNNEQSISIEKETKDNKPSSTCEEKKIEEKKIASTAPSSGTPTNTNDKSSSEVSSDDWEKEFDLDMTEEEIKEALGSGDRDQVESEDWENWE